MIKLNRVLCTVEGKVTFVETFALKDGSQGLSIKVSQNYPKGEIETVSIKIFNKEVLNRETYKVGDDVLITGVACGVWMREGKGGLNCVVW